MPDLDVADPGLIDVGDDLVAGGGFREAGGVGLEAAGGFVALVAIEDADGNVEGEAGGAVGSKAVVFGFEGGIAGAIDDGKAGAGICCRDAEVGRGVIGAIGERGLDELILGLGDEGRDDVAGDVEVLGREFYADDGLELVAGLAERDDVVGFVGFVVAELEVEAFEVQLAEVAGFEAVVSDVDFVAEVLEAADGEFERLLGDEHVWGFPIRWRRWGRGSWQEPERAPWKGSGSRVGQTRRSRPRA